MLLRVSFDTTTFLTLYVLFLKWILHDSFRNIKYNLCAFYNSYVDDYKYFKQRVFIYYLKTKITNSNSSTYFRKNFTVLLSFLSCIDSMIKVIVPSLLQSSKWRQQDVRIDIGGAHWKAVAKCLSRSSKPLWFE